MAATNPFRVSDLVKKYGWQSMIYLAALGIENLAETQILFVDSAHADCLDADDTEHGHSFEKPLATWDYAIGLCTAGERSIILLAPTHNEELGDAQVDIDVEGVATIGIGAGGLRPTIDFDHANSSIDIGANNVSIENVNLLPSTGSVLIGVHVESAFIGFRMKNVKFFVGEDGSGADEFVKAMELTSGNHDCVFEDVTILAHGSSAEATHGIHIAAASNRLTFRNVVIDGPYATGGIVEAATGVNHVVEDCAVDVSGTNYSFDGSSTFAKRTNNVDGQVTEDESESLLLTTRGSGNYPTGITDESILAYIMGAGGTASASTFVNTRDSLEAIGTAVAAITNQTGVINAVPGAPTAGSLQDALNKDRAGSNTYSSATDSLEAIRDHLDGTTVLAGINLDHFMKTAVVDEQDMGAEIANGSALAHILVKAAGGDVNDFDPTTDSLEAIADAVTGFTTAVSTTPTARSVQDILEKDAGGNFTAADDSLEAISDFVRTGTTLGAGINLDHLMKTAVGNKQDMSTEVANTSVLSHIMTKTDGDVNDFDPTTDSLEAIRDNQQTACRAAIDDAELDHLLELDGATQAYPENCANDSIIAKILCKGDPATINTYDCQTDSLEAISDLIRTGTSALAGLQLDHFLANTTSVAAGSDLEEFAVSGSLMAHVMGVGADVTTFDCRTDSLEALALGLGGWTLDGGAHYNDSIYSNLVLLSQYLVDGDGDFATGQKLPSDTSLVDIIGDFTGAHDGTNYNSNILACLKELSKYIVGGDGDFADGTALPSNVSMYEVLGAYTADGGADDEDTVMAHLDLIYADTKVNPFVATKTVTNLSAASGDTNIFTISGGPCKITSIVGVVANAIKNATINCKLVGDPTVPGNDVDITNVVDIDTAAAGTTLTPGATFGAALVLTANGVIGDMGFDFVMDDGNIKMNLSANGDADDSIEWYIRYEPLVDGAAIAAA